MNNDITLYSVSIITSHLQWEKIQNLAGNKQAIHFSGFEKQK